MRFALHIRKPDSRHGLPGFSMVWVHLYLNISCCSCFFLATDHWPLPAARCPLFPARYASRIVPFKAFRQTHKRSAFRSSVARPRPSANSQKFIRPQKKFPGAGPRAYRICNTVCNDGGLRRGRSRRGRLGGTGLSLRGGSLQGLLHRCEI